MVAVAITSETPQVSTRLEETERDQLVALAKQNERSFAAELRMAVKFYLAAQPKKAAA